MKKLIIILIAVIFTSINVQAQKGNSNEIIEFSVSGIYGQFGDEFVSEIYPNFYGYDASMITLGVKRLGAGIFIKNVSADGVPVLIGLEDPTASATMSFFSIGGEVNILLSKNLRIYTRFGATKFKESLNTFLGSTAAELDGKSFGFGIKALVPFGSGFKIFGKIGYEAIMLDGMEDDDRFNNLNAGLGLAFAI